MPPRLDLTGQRFGRLLVGERAPNQGPCTAWEVLCDCGARLEVRTDSLRSGNTQSCGCITVGQGMRKHGESFDVPEYRAWQLMKRRAKLSRGRVCVAERWAASYEGFLADMGRKPYPEATLDRIDSAGHYEPDNCRWASRRQQTQNIRSNREFRYKGEVKCLSQLAREAGLAPTTVAARLQAGWSVEKALETPPLHGTFERSVSVRKQFPAEYRAWLFMRNRCLNPTNKDFPLYGGRGVQVCSEWEGSFECFLGDVGPRPSAKHSLDRIDADLGYSPDNCRWAVSRTQQRNRRNNRLIAMGGETRCLQEWAERLGINHRVVRSRLQRGWDEVTALTTGVSNGHRVD